MNIEFVSYEQALELKELGFDEPCLGYYDTDGLKISHDWYINPTNRNSLFPEPHTTNNPKISAPLKSQIFRWFREKYKYNCFIPSSLIDGKFYYFREDLNNRNEDSEPELTPKFDTHEEAENSCIDKLIKLVKKPL
jgi:hypothetical protein